ncbi:hypothetical protein LCGC14_2267120 [marine sediment metagenome]|uniref:Uncharacterized protein n=1 Tax=marine sediment metagenome TaxID=412755 RepID=A0A0F9DKD1_9ZZZZ
MSEKKEEVKDSGDMIITRMEVKIIREEAEENFKEAVTLRMKIESVLKYAKEVEKKCLHVLNSINKDQAP